MMPLGHLVEDCLNTVPLGGIGGRTFACDLGAARWPTLAWASRNQCLWEGMSQSPGDEASHSESCHSVPRGAHLQLCLGLALGVGRLRALLRDTRAH